MSCQTLESKFLLFYVLSVTVHFKSSKALSLFCVWFVVWVVVLFSFAHLKNRHIISYFIVEKVT